jgi:DNA-directed RNA polymerase subunit RPC12/RpoP
MNSTKDSTKSVACPNCGALEFDFLANNLARCKYCGATFPLPEKEEPKADKYRPFGAETLEEQFEELGERLNNVFGSKTNTNSTADFTNSETGKTISKVAKTILIVSAVIFAVCALCAIIIPIVMFTKF